MQRHVSVGGKVYRPKYARRRRL